MNHHFFKTILAGAFAAAMILGGQDVRNPHLSLIFLPLPSV